MYTGFWLGKSQLGRTSRRWEDNIKRYLQKLGKGGHGLVLSGSGWGQVSGGNEPSGSIKFGEFLD